MKRAVSISLGSKNRDKAVEIELLGQSVSIERIGTDGNIDKATALFTELDGKVDALGVGGIDLWVQMNERRYKITAAHRLIKHVRQTPVVDGSGLKNTLEKLVVDTLIEELGPAYENGRVLLTVGVDRYGMTLAFVQQGYEVVYGDLMYAIGVPIAIRKFSHFQLLAKIMAPIATKLPISILYPTGDKQNEIVPKYGQWYAWANVLAGDCNYIKRHMPDDLQSKVIVTNTTTPHDMALFQERGVPYVMTTTPQVDGRSFGTNMLEAALTAVAGKNRPLSLAELDAMLKQLQMKPTLHKLTG